MAPGASAKEKKGVVALAKRHQVFLLKQAGIPVPDSGKERAAALLNVLQQPGGRTAACRRV